MTPMRASSRAISANTFPAIPTIIARNMPGAGGVIASNYLYNVAPQDGTTLAIIISSFAHEQLFDNPQIKYDARKFLAVGRLLDTTSVLFMWHASPIKTLRDLYTKPSTFGITSVNDVPAYRHQGDEPFPRHADQAHLRLSVGARLRAGVRARRDRRRRLDLYRAVAIVLVLPRREEAQHPGAVRAPPETPTCRTCRRSSNSRTIRRRGRFSTTSSTTTRSAAHCSQRPMCRRRGLRLLRSAFQKMMVDPDFRAEAEQLRLPLAPKIRRGDAEDRGGGPRHFAGREGQDHGDQQAVNSHAHRQPARSGA